MRVARRLRREVELWGVVWQQVETFLDRIDGARDQDAAARRTVEALLGAVAVVERHQRATLPDRALGAPVVATLPTQQADPGNPSGPPVAIGDPWAPEQRRARLPGVDEIELAAGPVAPVDLLGVPVEELTSVRLTGVQSIFTRPDPRTGAPAPILMPSYAPDATTAAASIVGSSTRLVAIAGDGGDSAVSLFSVARRTVATLGTDPDTEQVLPWSAVCLARRLGRTAQTPVPVDPASPSGLAAALAARATAAAAGLRDGVLGPAAAVAELAAILTAAQAAPASATADAAALQAAADALDAEGAADEGLAVALRAAATALGGLPTTLPQLTGAVADLLAAPGSASARNAVLDAAAAVGPPGAVPLLDMAVELGPLRADVDRATATRLSYPDGSLRILRTLETAFVGVWREWLRWFRLRHATVLAPLADRFRRPFTDSLAALLAGGDTGLLAVGLTVGTDTAVGADHIVSGQPASLVGALDDVEPGQVGIVGGDRPAALTVLGLDESAGRLTLAVAPLRVSVAPGPPGVAGLLPAGSPILAAAPGLTADELRSGESALGPAADGPVQEALALWSRLCLVHGWAVVQQALTGTATYATRSVPDPSATPLESLALHGAVPARAPTLVVTGLPAAFWDRADPHEPLPRLARPGELLLLRGRTAPNPDGRTGRLLQATVEVSTVVRTTGSMLARMDLSTAGRLATTPLDLDATQTPVLRCGPEEDVAVVTLRQTGMDEPLASEMSLRRDFAGFDLPSLATGRLLPLDLLENVLSGAPAQPPDLADVDRSREFRAALAVLTDWLRYAAAP